MNNIRVVFAHQPFEPDGKGGVLFNTEAARNKGLPKALTKEQLEAGHDCMAELEKELCQLYDGLRPIINFDELPFLSPPVPACAVSTDGHSWIVG